MDMPVLADQAWIYLYKLSEVRECSLEYIYIYILRLTTVWDLQYIDFIPFQKGKIDLPTEKLRFSLIHWTGSSCHYSQLKPNQKQ